MTAPEPPDDGPGPAPEEESGPVPADRPRSPGRTRTWIVVLLVAVALAVLAATAVILVTDTSGIHDGTGTATFSWTPVAQDVSTTTGTARPQPFSGTIDGLAVTGTSTAVLTPSSFIGADGQLPTGPVPAFRYRGTFAGSPFDLTLYYRFPASKLPISEAAAPAMMAGTGIAVVGTYGTSRVRATIAIPTPAGPTTDHPATFTGTVGHWKVTGTIPTPAGTSTRQTATAHFVLSG